MRGKLVAKEERVALPPHKLLKEKEVEAEFGIKVSKLQKMRSHRCKDPLPFVKIGGSIFYRVDQILKWLDRNTFHCVADIKFR